MAQEITVNQLLAKQHEESQATLRITTKAFEDLNTQIGLVNSSLLTQGALNEVPEFSGKSKVTDWIQDLEKCQSIHGLSDKDTCQLTWKKARGTVSQLIGRVITEKPTTTFEELKALLEEEYGNIVDKQQAFIQLANIRQGRGEDISSYTERMCQLANRAYGNNWRTVPNEFIEGQLVSIFMEGLQSHDVKMRIYRKQVKKFDDAVQLAKADDLAKKRFPGAFSARQRNEGHFPLRQREVEPMEVDHRRIRGCYQCGGPHRQRDCPKNKSRPTKVQLVHNRDGGFDKRRQWLKEEDWKYRRCYTCHQAGHFVAQCKLNQSN